MRQQPVTFTRNDPYVTSGDTPNTNDVRTCTTSFPHTSTSTHTEQIIIKHTSTIFSISIEITSTQLSQTVPINQGITKEL